MFGFVEMFFKYVMDLTHRGMMFQWVIDFLAGKEFSLSFDSDRSDWCGKTDEFELAEHVFQGILCPVWGCSSFRAAGTI